MVDAEKKSSLRKMLSDAVPLLCRSGLGIYNSKLSVEAIICITVNNKDLFHISFNELLTADGSTISHAWRKCEIPKVDARSEEPDHSKETSDALPLPDISGLDRRPLAEDENRSTTFQDQNVRCDGINGKGVCCGEPTEWKEVKASDVWSDSTSKRRRNKPSSLEKPLRQDRQVNRSERHVLDDSSHSRQEEGEALLPVSRNSTPGLAASDVKIEQLESEDCLFVKMETDVNNDDYGFSTVAEIANISGAFSVPVRKRSRKQTSFENYDDDGKHSFGRSTASKTTNSHVAHRQSHTRRSGDAAQDELSGLQVDRSLSLANYQATQSAASVLSSSGTLLPFPLDHHHPETIPPTASQFAPKKRCRVCYARKVRKEVRFCCSACPDRPGLCLNPCFYEYHEVFVMPKFFPEGATSERCGGSMQEHNSPVECSRTDVLHLPNMSGEAWQSPDA